MFTGLIERIGEIKASSPKGSGVVLEVGTGPEPFPVAAGESVAVDGVCLTVVSVVPAGFTVEASAESLSRSTLNSLSPRGRVNLERALKLGDRLGGHLVTGHVDGVGRIVEARPEGGFKKITISAGPEIMALVVEKGSIAVDGISLTVNGVGRDRFWLTLIPETLTRAALAPKKPGDAVNLETDLLGKYVAKLLGKSAPDSGLMKKLEEEGFI